MVWSTKSGIKIHRVLWGRCNCYLVSNENRFLLIDTGMKRNWKNLNNGLNRCGVREDSSIFLILTHCHFDHVGNAARFKETYKAPIIVHKSDTENLKKGESDPNIGGTVFLTKVLASIVIKTKQLQAWLRYDSTDYDISVDKELGLDTFGFSGRILHTPGHSPGSISVIIDEEIAIVGDTMFGVFSGSVFPPFANDVRLMVKSWKKLLETGCIMYLPAHGSERSKDILEQQYGQYKKLYNL